MLSLYLINHTQVDGTRWSWSWKNMLGKVSKIKPERMCGMIDGQWYKAIKARHK